MARAPGRSACPGTPACALHRRAVSAAPAKNKDFKKGLAGARRTSRHDRDEPHSGIRVCPESMAVHMGPLRHTRPEYSKRRPLQKYASQPRARMTGPGDDSGRLARARPWRHTGGQRAGTPRAPSLFQARFPHD
ncbi:hypothetical protein CBM2633_A70645 [Cupriavidus taiwanensis]|nr:hypothetical protein CBM2626_A150023 [Cupriavidus taiwanensis]SPA16912.1 hypothetical protein CBM2633_A70645 [Cupriavidus taiwanensis]